MERSRELAEFKRQAEASSSAPGTTSARRHSMDGS